ncbi:MAG TPA: glycerophosphodiester phosphodiesterase [Terriglobia bacterium]|nr:glycerophosphodiester phosphodiesterase [Terriglobia bacterium]
MRPLVVGHRGAAAHALENTTASFEKAVKLGVDMIELDVHESLDPEFIVIHDTHVGRISSRRDIVRQTHSRFLRSIELHEHQKLLTLCEACATIPKQVGLMVEIKTLRNLERMAQLMEAEGQLREILLTSFDLSLLQRLQRISPSLRLGVVSRTVANPSKAKSLGLEFHTVCLDFHCLTRPVMPRLKKEYGRVFAWTVDRQRDIERVSQLGVDGIISNRPDEVHRILKNFQARGGH